MNTFSNGKSKEEKNKMQTSRTVSRVLKDRVFRKSSRSLTRVVRDINFHEPAFASCTTQNLYLLWNLYL